MNQGEQARCRAYIAGIGSDLRSTLQAGLEFVQWEKYVNRNTRVFVKPNFTFPTYREGITTSPELLKHLLKILAGRAGKVMVGESDGGGRSFKAEESLAGHDMYRICQETGAEPVSLSALPWETVRSRVLGRTVEVQLPRLLLEDVDCFISVPVLKVHVMTTVTLSLKNSWGCHPDTMRGLHHQDLSRKLALIARSVKPRIVVVDGAYALNKHGPMHGEAVKTDLLLVADNTVAADALGASIMGFAPQKIDHIKIAEQAGLGPTRLADVEMNQDWTKLRRQFEVQRSLVDSLSLLPFNNDLLARLIMSSPLTPAIYRIVGLLKTADEKKVDKEMSTGKNMGVY